MFALPNLDHVNSLKGKPKMTGAILFETWLLRLVEELLCLIKQIVSVPSGSREDESVEDGMNQEEKERWSKGISSV